MADTKLSALTALATEPADTDEFYINDGGTSKKIAWSTIKAVFALAAQGATADTALQDVVDDTSPTLGGALDADGFDINNGGVIFLTEQAAAEADVAGKGQIWVKTATPNELWFTDDAGTDVQLGAGGGSGDFKADGTVDMTGAFGTDVGTFRSDVADGASSVAFNFNTSNAFSTSGGLLWRVQNNGASVLGLSFQGGFSHLNSGASTSAHAQSYNFNLTASGTQTSSGQYSVVMGRQNTASALGAVAIGQACSASGVNTVAMGINSSASQGIAIGNACTASGNMAVAMGHTNTASGPYSAIFGFQGSIQNRTCLGIGAGRFAADGDAQVMTITAKVATTNATQTDLSNAGTTIAIPADTTWAFSALIAARSDESDGNDSAVYRLDGCIARDESNNTALVGSITKTVIAESAGATAWDVTAEADDTNEALAIKVTGEASTNIRWVAKVDISSVTYA